MTRRLRFAAHAALLAILGAHAPAVASGLGPLSSEGNTANERKGFYLTLINPHPTRESIRLYAVGWDDELPQPEVYVPSPIMTLPPGSHRRVLIVAAGLTPGETYRFRVCAEQAEPDQRAMINARVCSKLVAHRVG
jgi:hypothetical protein